MNLNKKQVGALLKVVSKDTAREVLTCAYVTGGKLYATDGYVAAILNISDSEASSELEGRLIRRDALERWYKLATSKDRLTGEELVSVSSEDYGHNGGYADLKYPDVQSVVDNAEEEESGAMAFNADYAKILQELSGEALDYKLHGKLGPMIANTDAGLFVLMPMKKQ